jgi:hypothetical protein
MTRVPCAFQFVDPKPASQGCSTVYFLVFDLTSLHVGHLNFSNSTMFSGSLQPKKKSELQAIAGALGLNDVGTKEDLQIRIKAHLDKHQATLEEDPDFAGLFGKRKKSVQPPLRYVQPLLVHITQISTE